MKVSSSGTIPGLSATHPAAGTGSWLATIARRSGKALDLLVQWRDRAVQRRHLNELNDRLLADIGLTRIDACREAGKPFWKA